jgi:hypothetical protein
MHGGPGEDGQNKRRTHACLNRSNCSWKLKMLEVCSMYYIYIDLNIWWRPCLWFQQLHKCVARPVASSVITGDPVIHVSFGLSVTFATLPICDHLFLSTSSIYVHHYYILFTFSPVCFFPGAFYEPLLHSVYGCTNYIWSEELLYVHDVRVGLAVFS